MKKPRVRKPTLADQLKRAENETITLRELRQEDARSIKRVQDQLLSIQAELNRHIEIRKELERDKQWLRQLVQNLSEAVCTHARNR